jgi:hypothetical protein
VREAYEVERAYETPSISELVEELREKLDNVDESIGELYGANAKYAEAEHEYRMARARAWIQTVEEYKSKPRSERPTVDHIEAIVDLSVEKERFRAKLAEGIKEAAMESVRSRRTQLSAVQTVANAYRAEIEFSRQHGDR